MKLVIIRRVVDAVQRDLGERDNRLRALRATRPHTVGYAGVCDQDLGGGVRLRTNEPASGLIEIGFVSERLVSCRLAFEPAPAPHLAHVLPHETFTSM
jgi:hypothetical protein